MFPFECVQETWMQGVEMADEALVEMTDVSTEAGPSRRTLLPAPSNAAMALFADLSLDEGEDVMEKLSERYLSEVRAVFEAFNSWSPAEQNDFLHRRVIPSLTHARLGALQNAIQPMLQRDFLATLPANLADIILAHLDAASLESCELVSHTWRAVMAMLSTWRRLIESRVRTDPLWAGLAEKRMWSQFVNQPRELATRRILEARGLLAAELPDFSVTQIQSTFYQRLHKYIVRDIAEIENRWRHGIYSLSRINCQSVYCLQYDAEKIVSGLRDNTIKIWRRSDLSCVMTLSGHTGSVLCLQYDDRVIISGSSDATVRVWCVNTGVELNVLIHHCEAVLHLRFANGIMVTCSKDRSIAVWDMVSPTEINLRRVLVGHRAAVNVVDFDSRFIVSASGDRTIKVWSADTCEFVRTLSGHKRGIACLQYRDRLVVSGSSDNTIRLWDIHCGQCLRVLEGHEELVRCIRFDSKRIVSGAYDGKIKVWDLKAALDPAAHPGSICLTTLVQHTGRVFRLQFDEFQIVSSSHDDTILIWDFVPEEKRTPYSSRNSVSEPGPSQPTTEGASAEEADEEQVIVDSEGDEVDRPSAPVPPASPAKVDEQ